MFSWTPGLLISLIHKEPAIGLFSKAELGTTGVRGEGCLLFMHQFIQGHTGVAGWVSPSDSSPGLTLRETRTVPFQLFPVNTSCSIPVGTHTCAHTHAHTPRHILLCLRHMILLFRSYLHFKTFYAMKSQLVTKVKQTECLKEVSSCHGGREMKSKHLKLLVCFHGKSLHLKNVLPALSVAGKCLGLRAVL